MSRGAMLVDQVSDQDVPIGRAMRADVFVARTNFRVVHILAFDAGGNLLLQQIPARPDARHPGLWGSSVAGYVAAGESYQDAARRKLREELSLDPVRISRVGNTSMIDSGVRKFIGVFTIEMTFPPRANPDDFAAWSILAAADLSAPSKTGLSFTPTFLHVLDFYRGQTTPRRTTAGP